MTMTPLDRTARALYLRKPTVEIFTDAMENPNKLRGFVTGDIPWEDASDEERSAYINAARAALEAIREPSGPMIVAGGNCLTPEDGTAGGDHSAVDVWTEMIDAALAE